jgi:hypothetical protein
MSWLDTFSDDEQQTVEELQNKGITGKPTQQKKMLVYLLVLPILLFVVLVLDLLKSLIL